MTAVVLAAALVLAGTGCSKKISSSDPSNKATVEIVDPMSYAAIDAKMREYTFGLNEYMREHAAEVTQKTADGATLGGVKALCTYTLSPGDSIFITRTTVYNDGNFEPVDKYYIIGGALYKVDITDQTVTKLKDLNDPAIEETQANIDIYLSFEEIRALYA